MPDDAPPPVLPLPYSRWMDELLGGEVPREPRATCDECAMCVAAHRALLPSEFSFNPETKCCTFCPELPNFLLGRILSDDSPESAAGRALVEARMKDRGTITPFGMGRPIGYLVVYRNLSGQAFGRNKGLRCPYYLEDSGRCGIWRHREATCSTWFCKYERGGLGRRFWLAMFQLLVNIERTLTVWCVNQLDPGPEALELLFPTTVARNSLMDWHENLGEFGTGEALWGRWLGREAEYFREAARLVDGLSWSRLLEIGGPELHTFGRLLRDAYGAHQSTELPPNLRVGQMRMVATGGKTSQFWTYSNLDAMEMPLRLLDVLHLFDGRPTRDAIHEVFMEYGVNLDEDVVRQLADFEVLVPVERLVRRPAAEDAVVPATADRPRST